MESLSDKLKSLGVRTGFGSKEKPAPPKDGFDISTVVAGREFETALGTTFMVENDYPFEHFVGNEHLFHPLNLATIGQWAGLRDLAEQSIDSMVLLDTETSGLVGGTGTFAFLIGLGFRTQAGYRVVQLFMRDPSQEPALLAGLSLILSGFKTMITFNGKSFDAPLLNTRHVLNTIPNPLVHLHHIDLLPLARRLWRNRLPSRALKDLETEILGMSRTDEEVPGWMIPEIYYEYLRTRDARPLGGVLYHNAQDILSLGLLFNHMADLLDHPLDIAPEQGLDIIAIARLYEDLLQ
ncbi:MAG: ribonuclease H-like domain-containing protein, partial [Saprospiraceae bacterium]|nr:ribonuclease H-like domain-containing protein [Saprospiraceae bacterium]